MTDFRHIDAKYDPSYNNGVYALKEYLQNTLKKFKDSSYDAADCGKSFTVIPYPYGEMDDRPQCQQFDYSAFIYQSHKGASLSFAEFKKLNHKSLRFIKTAS